MSEELQAKIKELEAALELRYEAEVGWRRKPTHVMDGITEIGLADKVRVRDGPTSVDENQDYMVVSIQRHEDGELTIRLLTRDQWTEHCEKMKRVLETVHS